jgi:hypothetical protein
MTVLSMATDGLLAEKSISEPDDRVRSISGRISRIAS